MDRASVSRLLHKGKALGIIGGIHGSVVVDISSGSFTVEILLDHALMEEGESVSHMGMLFQWTLLDLLFTSTPSKMKKLQHDNLPIFHLERISTGDNIPELRVSESSALQDARNSPEKLRRLSLSNSFP
jgi:hypothetical protein